MEVGTPATNINENERFANGPVERIKSIGETDCFSVVGGGDTARTFSMYDVDEPK